MLKPMLTCAFIVTALQLPGAAWSQPLPAATLPKNEPVGADKPMPQPQAEPEPAKVPGNAQGNGGAPSLQPAVEPQPSASVSPAVTPGTSAPEAAQTRSSLDGSRYPLPVVVTEAPPPDIAQQPKTYEHRVSLTLDFANVLWRTTRAYDLISTNDTAYRIALGAGYDVVKVPEALVFAAEVGAMVEPGQGAYSDGGLIGNTLHGDLSGTTLLGGGTLRWAGLSWLAPYGRAQLLVSRYAVTLRTENASGTYGTSSEWSYRRWPVGGALGAGVMLTLPPRSPVNGGVMIEGGYWLQQSIDLVLDDGSVPAGNIATYGAKLGTLGNSGPYVRIAGVLRF